MRPDHPGPKVPQAPKVLRAPQVQMEKMVSLDLQEQGVPLAHEEMTVPPVNKEPRESPGLGDSLVRMVILAIRVKQGPQVPKDRQVLPDHREQEETGDPLGREEPPVPREIRDHKDRQETRDHVVTRVPREKKDYKEPRVKREIRDGLAFLVPLEPLARLATRVTQVPPARVDSQGQKEIEVKTALMDLPAHLDRKDLGEELVYRVPRETGDQQERGVTQEIRDLLDHRDLLETSVRI